MHRVMNLEAKVGKRDVLRLCAIKLAVNLGQLHICVFPKLTEQFAKRFADLVLLFVPSEYEFGQLFRLVNRFSKVARN